MRADVTKASGGSRHYGAAITVSSDVQLLNFSLRITAQTSVPQLPAVFMPPTAQVTEKEKQALSQFSAHVCPEPVLANHRGL